MFVLCLVVYGGLVGDVLYWLGFDVNWDCLCLCIYDV